MCYKAFKLGFIAHLLYTVTHLDTPCNPPPRFTFVTRRIENYASDIRLCRFNRNNRCKRIVNADTQSIRIANAGGQGRVFFYLHFI